MDAAEVEQDVKLQRTSPELLAELQACLRPFVWKTNAAGKTHIRRRVKASETARLVNLLEPFQELPQLLDPHLEKLVPVLADAFLAYLQLRPSKRPVEHTDLLIPLSRSICRLLYTFCKIRGEKVIVRFFSTETRYLELLLSSIENGGATTGPQSILGQVDHGDTKSPDPNAWRWEERYITLLWLSQLLLAPFDLASISSQSTEDAPVPNISGLAWPPNVPGITLRVIPLAIQYLSSSSKESAAAKVLLVRVAMRKDMQETRILDALIEWAVTSLQVSSRSTEVSSPYHVIGLLSFLAGVFSAAVGTSDMDPYILRVFKFFESIASEETVGIYGTPFFQTIRSSSVASKVIIKIFRTLSLLLVRKSGNLEEVDGALLKSVGGADNAEDMIATAISSCLVYVENPATPVRLAASKALSIITLKLNPELGSEVVDAVLIGLEANVLWVDSTHKDLLISTGAGIPDSRSSPRKKIRDLSRVNHLAWHGLIWTLSSLLYRHSPPVESLPQIISYLLVGLSFEQRSSNGASIGTNVRDAACFGIWAIARRYRTDELQSIQVDSSFVSDEELLESNGEQSVLQILATRLIVSASLDPSGNIRRASSAALQELIGRHPNTIVEGIQIVQVVDYHAVARRSRAVEEVAFGAAKLSDQYCFALLGGLLGWRGVKDGDVAARRSAAFAFGSLLWQMRRQYHAGQPTFFGIITGLEMRVRQLASRELEGRHGLLLCIAAALKHLQQDLTAVGIAKELRASQGPSVLAAQIQSVVRSVAALLLDMKQEIGNLRSPHLVAEAISRLLTATYPIAQAECAFRGYETHTRRISSEISATEFSHYLPDFQSDLPSFSSLLNYPSMNFETSSSAAKFACENTQTLLADGFSLDQNLLSLASDLVVSFHALNEDECADAVSEAAANLLLVLDSEQKGNLISTFSSSFVDAYRSGKPPGKGTLYTLFKLIPLCSKEEQLQIFHEIRDWAWAKSTTRDIDTCATILQCLSQSSTLLSSPASVVIETIHEGLDDFTTNSRGDVGSILRIEAVKATGAIWRHNNELQPYLEVLFGKTLRCASEKLDKVRTEAQLAITCVLGEAFAVQFKKHLSSSIEYFHFLLDLQTNDMLAPIPFIRVWSFQMLSGFVTSADTGNEELVRASRSALVTYCESGDQQREVVCNALFEIMEAEQKNDRVVVPVLEVISFLFDAGVLQSPIIGSTLPKGYKSLYNRVQICHYRSSNVRKIEACVKVYGGLANMEDMRDIILKKLIGMLKHQYPTVRQIVAEQLWVLGDDKVGALKGVAWGRKVEEAQLQNVRGGFEIV